MKDKIIAGLLLACTLAFFYIQSASKPDSNDANSITLERSKQIYAALGGDPANKPISLFVTDWCPLCRALEEELHAKGISFVSADIEKDRDAFHLYTSLVGGPSGGVPLTVVGERIVLGMRTAEILKAYNSIR